ncbi:hypothetical protein PanWU01x14_242700, partial [Parasponia andersonii]
DWEGIIIALPLKPHPSLPPSYLGLASSPERCSSATYPHHNLTCTLILTLTLTLTLTLSRSRTDSDLQDSRRDNSSVRFNISAILLIIIYI